MNLTPGMRAEIKRVVTYEETAARMGSGGVEVLATPMMIALMEGAATQAVVSGLDEGQVTVGMVVNVRHLAATPVGQEVRAVAELVEVERRRLVFRVEAFDERQKIGEGVHERFVVDLERFLRRVGGS